MARADRLSRLISSWQHDEQQLQYIANHFREHGDEKCAEIADFGLQVLRRCLNDYQRANYPLDDKGN